MSEPHASGRLRRDLPFRRIALILSGGGALGAYEVGVLKTFRALGLRPAIVAGVSIGAVNAAVWVAHDFATATLERAWARMRPATIGLRWITLAWRWLGVAIVVFAVAQLVLLLAGSRELSGAYWFWRKSSGRADLMSALLEAASWLVVGALGIVALLLSRRAESWFVRQSPVADPQRLHRRLGWALLGLVCVHATVWILGWAWPHRFSAIALIVMGAVWFANRPGRTGDDLRRVLRGLLPETHGRGLWTSAARRQVIEDLIGTGGRRLLEGDTTLVIGTLALDSGAICHFVSPQGWTPGLGEKLVAQRAEVLPMRDPEDVVRAVLASSAIPGVFEPVRIAGRDLVDAGGFSNQPLHVAMGLDADALIAVLMTPSAGLPRRPPVSNLFDLAGRMLEIANWRDMQTELRQLPAGWTRDERPSRTCVVEPDGELPGSVLEFAPEMAHALIERGERDARLALERAGWLES